jgi:hypothetical protein
MEKAFLSLDKQMARLTRVAEWEVGRQYGLMLKEIRAVLQKAYDRYSLADGSLTYSQMARYGRIDILNADIEEITRKYTGRVAGEIRSGLRKTVTTSFEGTRGALEEAAGRKIRGILKPEIISEILQNPISGLSLNEHLAVRRYETITTIRQEMTRGLVRGDRYRDISSRLQNSLEIDAGKATRIVRTEAHRCMEAGKKVSLDNAANQGVELRKWWKDSADERVRSGHRHMGKKYSKENAIPYDEDFVNDLTGGTGPHPGALGTAEDDLNCRCIMVIEIGS